MSILSRGQINFQPTPIFVNKNSSFALPELAFVIFFTGFRRNVLTSEVAEKWFENGLREPARPCCFPVLRPRFLRSRRLSNMVSTAFAWKPPKNVIQIFVFVRFAAMCAAGFAGNAVQNHGFVCRETTKSWNETLYFLEDSDATF